MKHSVLLVILCLPLSMLAQDQKQHQKPATLKSILLEELKSTHDKKDWFVDGNTAVAGLTAERANWKDGSGNHSVGQLAYHLVFWNQQELAKFKGETPAKYSDKNDDTFNNFDSKQWATVVQQFDQVMTDWEKAVEAADDNKIAAKASDISHIATHNAYPIGQIVFVRKLQGSWDPEKGVK
jgi:uncharacterized damage-inducible protein DinB